MRYQSYITEGNNVTDVIKRLSKMGYRKAEKELKGSTKGILQLFLDKGMQEEALLIINKHLKTRFKSLKDIGRQHRIPIREGEEILNEDLKHLWGFIESQSWVGLAFFPILQLYLELEKLLSNSGVDYKRILIYGAIFMFIMSAKHVQLFNKWKDTHEKDWEMEGRPTAFGKGPGRRPEVKKAIKQAQDYPDMSKTSGRLGFALRS